MLSALNALYLSPALEVLLLKPAVKGNKGLLAKFFGGFNRGFEWTTNKYLSGVRGLMRKSALAIIALLAFFVGTGYLFKTLPAGFLPDEDQGVFFIAVRLPDGASLERTQGARSEVEGIVKAMPGVADVTTFGGLD